jgi:hypothetical protein
MMGPNALFRAGPFGEGMRIFLMEPPERYQPWKRLKGITCGMALMTPIQSS